jgi:hypothetical protein
MIIKRIIITSAILIAVSACSTTTPYKQTINKELPGIKEVPASEIYEALANASVDAAKALTILSEVKTASVSEIMTYDSVRQANWRANYVPEGMDRKITIKWDGPATPVLKQIERYVDYDVILMNRKSPIPNIITIDSYNESIINIIRKISAQTEGLMDITIFEDAKKIEVRYVN